MDNNELLDFAKAIIHQYELGEEKKMAECMHRLRLELGKDPVAKLQCSDGLSGTIPLLRGKPEITNNMKAQCHGEFTYDFEATCTACYYHGAQEDCEVCGGEITYTQKIEVPWDTVKDIYKSMAAVAMEAT